MFPITDDVLALFDKSYLQTVEITFSGVNQDLVLTQKDIKQGTLVIDRYSVSGSKIELGSASAAELSVQLDNSDGRFNDVVFEGSELYVKIGIKKYDAHQWENATIHYIPCGYFTIDEPPRKLTSISISALDRMVLFDKVVDWSLFTFPISIADIITQTCTICNVPLATTVSTLPNHDYMIPTAPTDDTTYRQIIQWAATITASCAFIDWEGKLRLQWYTACSRKITAHERYSSDMLENDISITGVELTDTFGNTYLRGNNNYAFLIENNSLIQGSYQSVIDNIYAVVSGFTYRPFSCISHPAPYLYPLDVITYTDAKGVDHSTIVTNVTYSPNTNTSISGKGETAKANNQAVSNPLTNKESLIIKTITNAFNDTLNKSVQSVLAFNELITNALGVYSTVITEADGSKKYYMHDNPAIETSQTIYTMTAGGFAYTNTGWNNGNPVWQYGFSKDGNIVAKKVDTYGISVSDPSTKYSSQITPGVFSVWFGAMQILTVNGDKSILTKVKVTEQAECGKVRVTPHTINGELVGTNVIFMED